MSFGDAVQSVLQNFANFRGRAMRSEFWWWFVFTIIAGIAVSLLDATLGTNGLIGALWGLVAFVAGLALWVRRLHDVDHSGWWLLIGVVPLIGFLVLLYWAIKPGDAGPNQYGPPPLPDPA